MGVNKLDNKKMDKFKAQFLKDFGAETLHDGNEIKKPTAISTGSIALDYATSLGGYPEGRMTEIWGVDDIGKTTFALLGVAEAQKQYPDRVVAWVDVENKLDKEWAEAHGVDLDRLWVYVPATAEETADAVSRFLGENFVSMLVVDSIGAMIGRVEIEKNADESTVAIVAKIVTRMVRAANSQAKHGNPAILLINQIRSNIGGYGSATMLPGGWALKFQTTMRIKLAKTAKQAYKAKVGAGDPIEVAREIAATIERNKCAPKGRTAMVMLVSVPTKKYGPIGVDKVAEVVTVGKDTGIIKRGGAWYTMPDGERFMGEDAVLEYVYANPHLVDELRTQIIALRAEEITDDLGNELEEVEIQKMEGGEDL